MTKTLAAYWNFFWQGLVRSGQTGAVVPSQRFLIQKMISPVPHAYTGRIVELGPGNGALTRRLAARCPQARILACEINPAMARDCQDTIKAAGLSQQVELVCDSAEHLLGELTAKGAPAPDFVISGIPLANLDHQLVMTLLERIHKCLAPGGLYIQFQHSLLDRKNIVQQFSSVRTVPVVLNFPPAVVYFARK